MQFKHALYLITAAGLLVIVWMFFHAFGWFLYLDKQHAESIADNVTEYFTLHGKLPDSDDTELMQSLGFERAAEQRHPVYYPRTTTEFELGLHRGFDGPYYCYNSTTGEWISQACQ